MISKPFTQPLYPDPHFVNLETLDGQAVRITAFRRLINDEILAELGEMRGAIGDQKCAFRARCEKRVYLLAQYIIHQLNGGVEIVGGDHNHTPYLIDYPLHKDCLPWCQLLFSAGETLGLTCHSPSW